MASDPTRRLDRPLPGARIPADARGFDRLFAREAADARPEPVPPRDRAELRMVVRRPTHRVASCQPNAPLLIRIVRYPFRLDTSRPGRRTYLEPAVRFERVDWSAVRAGALADRERLSFTSGGRGRPRPFAVRPSEWSLIPPGAAPTREGDEP